MRYGEQTIAGIQALLQPAKTVLIITHLAPDGDAIGSLTAAGLALQQLGKEVTLACDDPAPDRFSYLALVDEIIQPAENAGIPHPHYDLLISLDCGDKERMGQSYSQLPDSHILPIINIDHHITNTHFGQINLVDTNVTATTEILYYLLPQLGASLSQPMAVSLLTGLMTDTLGLRISSVTADTVRVASELMEAGADLSQITDRALNSHPLSTLKLYQKGLNNMHFQDGLLWTCISNEERLAAGHDNGSSAGLVSQFGNVEEAIMGAVLIEMEPGKVVVGFRCRPPWDVATLATSLGGGGHQYASGCSVEGTLAQAEALVVSRGLQAIRQQLAQQNKQND